ncbi:MAG: hypothetical protein ACO3RX_10620, partial [Chthoniobacterales bacterium]
GTQWLAPWLSGASLIDRAWSLLAIIGVAAAVYFALCALLRVEEARDALALIKRKISRRAVSPPGA